MTDVDPLTAPRRSTQRGDGGDRRQAEPETELTLDDMLADPIIHLVMRRDGVDEAQVRALVRRAAQRVAQTEPRSFAPVPQAVPNVEPGPTLAVEMALPATAPVIG